MFHQLADPLNATLLREYGERWRRSIFTEIHPSPDPGRIEPRGFQVEALYCLDEGRKEDLRKTLLVAATGVGKTYLAAFDSRPFRRVLFVAHREELLKQAEETFHKVRPSDSTGFYIGQRRETEVNLLFATVQSLARKESLNGEIFSPDEFDYIVIDEFHHAAAESYRRVLEYFKPQFLLGLTATPFRADNRDILHFCDDNIVYEIRLRDAIHRGYLVPFHYFAFFDDTDYDTIDYRNGSYDMAQLEKALSRSRRQDLVLQKFRQYSPQRALGFCASVAHAENMAVFMAANGIPCAVVHSGEARSSHWLPRNEAIQQLSSGRLRILFSVDLFNEGIDIPEIETVLFLRPTESAVVFLQQLGRGLRLAEGKRYLTVLDFIGNYRKAHHIHLLLAGKNPLSAPSETACYLRAEDFEYPDDCQVNFDFRLIDLFQEMRRNDPLRVRMREEYFRLKQELGRRPARIDIYEGSDIPISRFLAEDGYLGFLHSVDEFTSEEEDWLKSQNEAEQFLREIERNAMSKSYKMPTLLAFVDESNQWHPEAGAERMLESWRRYYAEPSRESDLAKPLRQFTDRQLFREAEKNPIHFLSQARTFFEYDKAGKVFSLAPRVRGVLTPSLAGHFRDIIEWRSRVYFARTFKKDEQD